MRAIVAFDRDRVEWTMFQLNLTVDFAMNLDTIKRGFNKFGMIKFPHILEVEIDTLKMTGEKSWSWSSSELPATPTLEECIVENRANILACLSRL